MKLPHLFERFWQTMPHIAGRSMIGAVVVFSLVVAGTVVTNTFSSSGINRSLVGELSPTVSGQSANGDKVAIKRQPTIECSIDSQCGGGQMCYGGQCKSIFECKPFVDARWQKGDGPDAKGIFEVKNPEYISIVPIYSRTSKMAAVRFTGGPLGTHTYERAIIKQFKTQKEIWGGIIYANFKNLVYGEGQAEKLAVFAGGYTDILWPQSGSGTWWRDFGATAAFGPIVEPYDPNAKWTYGIGMAAYYHNAAGPGNFIEGMRPQGTSGGWPDKFLKIQWQYTQAHELYAQVEGRPWVRIPFKPANPDPSLFKFRGFAAGWISSFAGGYLDIRSVQLFDDSCFPVLGTQTD